MKSAYLAGLCLLGALPTLVHAQSGNELQYAESGRPGLLNPHINPTHTGPTDRLLSMIYEPLFRWNTDKEEFESVLAKGFEKTTPKSPQNLAYIIKLKEGVRWHNGQAFTAGDVVFTYNFIKRFGRDEDQKLSFNRQIVTLEKYGSSAFQLYLELRPVGSLALGLGPQEVLQWVIIPANRFQNFQPLKVFLQELPKKKTYSPFATNFATAADL